MNSDITIVTSILINASPELVWTYLVDWENLGSWMKEGKDFRVTSPSREGEGVTAVATIRIAGISTTDEIRVTKWEPPRVLEIDHLGWVSGNGRMVCTPRGEATVLTWEERLSPPLGAAGALGIRVFKPLMRRIFLRDLHTLKDMIESSVERGSAGR